MSTFSPQVLSEDACHTFPRIRYCFAPSWGFCTLTYSPPRWRHTDPSYGSRNYWQCPTCRFQYRVQRVSWGRAINNATTRVALTATIFLLATFALGFVADPIIGLYLDPYDTVTTGFGSRRSSLFEAPVDLKQAGWAQHFVKGLASLGLLGFVKVFFALSPWQWWNLRSSGILNSGTRGGTTGRDRVANISWVVIVLGVLTFLWVCSDVSY